MELKNFIFQAWKVMELSGRFLKVLWNCNVVTFCVNEVPRQQSWKEYPRTKSAKAKNFVYLVVKCAGLAYIMLKGHLHSTSFFQGLCSWISVWTLVYQLTSSTKFVWTRLILHPLLTASGILTGCRARRVGISGIMTWASRGYKIRLRELLLICTLDEM